MVTGHHVADDAGGLAEGTIGRVAGLAHRIENATLDRLEAIADIGKRPRHDHAHGVIEVAPAQFVLD